VVEVTGLVSRRNDKQLSVSRGTINARDRTLNLGLRYHSPSSLLFPTASPGKATLSARFKSVKCFDQKTKGERMLPLGFLVEVTGL